MSSATKKGNVSEYKSTKHTFLKNDVLYGNKLVMDLDSGKSRVFSESGNSRVKMRFVPAQK